ncbi:MAG: hypothetical protein RL722_2818, partial [Pseudomonadota bacterium]
MTSSSPRQPQVAAWRSLLLRELRIGLPICVGVALFLTVVFHDSFSINLVFSLCIGFSI